MIEGISHVTFIVKDLELATKFFKEIFGVAEVYSSEILHSQYRERNSS